jgi:hypothetical protein
MKKVLVPRTWKRRSASVARFMRHPATSAAGAAAYAGAPIPTGPAFPVVPAGSEVVWVYAVTAAVDPALLSDLRGVAGEPLRMVTEAGLSAVVGSISDTAWADKSLSSLLADLTTIEAAGRAHHHVIASVAAYGPVLPLRLATVYADDETIAALLAERHSELTIMLESFRGTQEWDVKVYVEPWDENLFWSGRDDPVEACAEEIGHALSGIAVATRRRPSSRPRIGDKAGWMVLNSAYLLDSEHASRFSEIVAAVTSAHSALRADVSGPWPPYSFADR